MMARQEFRHPIRPTENLDGIRRRPYFVLDFFPQGCITTHDHSELDIGTLSEAAHKTGGFFLSGID
jgi:hypothetical protein